MGNTVEISELQAMFQTSEREVEERMDQLTYWTDVDHIECVGRKGDRATAVIGSRIIKVDGEEVKGQSKGKRDNTFRFVVKRIPCYVDEYGDVIRDESLTSKFKKFKSYKHENSEFNLVEEDLALIKESAGLNTYFRCQVCHTRSLAPATIMAKRCNGVPDRIVESKMIDRPFDRDVDSLYDEDFRGTACDFYSKEAFDEHMLEVHGITVTE